MVATSLIEEKSEEVKPIEPWQEPTTVDALLDSYIIESKFAGRAAGSVLYLVHSKKRDGSLDQIAEGQRFKLFLAPSFAFQIQFWPSKD